MNTIRFEHRGSMELSRSAWRRALPFLIAAYAFGCMQLKDSTIAAQPAQRPSADTPGDQQDPAPWSAAIDGLELRLRAPRTEFQSWELPTFTLEVRNTTAVPFTRESVFGLVGNYFPRRPGLSFLFQGEHKRATADPSSWLLPIIQLDSKRKLTEIKPGESADIEVTLAATRDSHVFKDLPLPLRPGRYTIGIGEIEGLQTTQLKSNSVSLTVLPPGAPSVEELSGSLDPYSVNDREIYAGFVPASTIVVWGEPLVASFVIQNPGDRDISFLFGGDYRNENGRHDRFKIEAIDALGNVLPDPTRGFNFGGIGGTRVAPARDLVVETIDLTKYRVFPRPGTYTVTCRFDLENPRRESDSPFNITAESSFTLIVLPPTDLNVDQRLAELFDRCDRTAGEPLTQIVAMITSFGQNRAVPGLAKMSTEGDEAHRIAAAIGLESIATPDSMEALLRASRDRQTTVRAAAIAALGGFPDPRSLETVVAAMSDSEETIQSAAASALGQMKSEAAIEALLRSAAAASPRQTTSILKAMGASRSQRVLEFIAGSLSNNDPDIRRAAAEAATHFPVGDSVRMLRPFVTDSDLDFREHVITILAEKLRQPIDPAWLVPVIKSRKGTHTIGHAPSLLRFYTDDKAAPTLLSCLDFEDPAINKYYNWVIIEQQLAANGLAVPWHYDLNRVGTPVEIAENRQMLRQLKAWVDFHEANQIVEAQSPQRRRDMTPEEEERTWGAAADSLQIRAHANRSIWPAGMPQVVEVEAIHFPNGGSVVFDARPTVVEVEVNSEWYFLPPTAEFSVVGEWNSYRGHAFHSLQLDRRWLRKSDDRPLDLTPGDYECCVRLSIMPEDRRTGLATSLPVKFKVIATE